MQAQVCGACVEAKKIALSVVVVGVGVSLVLPYVVLAYLMAA